MDGTGFSVLTAIIFIPIIAGVVILFLDRKNRDLVRGVGVTAASAVLALSLAVFLRLTTISSKSDGGLIKTSSAPCWRPARSSAARKCSPTRWLLSSGSFGWSRSASPITSASMAYRRRWCCSPAWSRWLAFLISWNIQDRLREFMAFFMFLVAGVYGVFIAVDLFMLFFFYELAIFPMYLLIAGWGWVKLREYAAMKLTLYILVGSVFRAGRRGGDVLRRRRILCRQRRRCLSGRMSRAACCPPTANPTVGASRSSRWRRKTAPSRIDILGIEGLSFARFWFPFMFMGFGVLAGVFPFHNWSPDGHVAAPTAVSMIHAGVLMKVGAFAALRAGVQLAAGRRRHALALDRLPDAD